MKIAVIIETSLGTGGGFDQALNATLQMQRLCSGRYGFEVFTSKPGNIEILARLGVAAEQIYVTISDRSLARVVNSALWHIVQRRLRFVGKIERKLLSRQVDLVYFVTPSNLPLGLQRLNFITTLWDLCHRDNPEFPEVRAFGEFYARENTHRNLVASAYLTLCDSCNLAQLASFRYGVDRDRFLPMPFGVSPLLDRQKSLSTEQVQKKYKIPQHYYYYPAQFWAHKNHIRILDALAILRDQHNYRPAVVFSGKDFGSLDWVLRSIRERRLELQVFILGFIPSDEVRGLYEGAAAIVMPTYFGPTNLPPLEAWSVGVPLIYSRHLFAQVQDAAELVDPDDSQSVADAMLRILSDERRSQLVSAGVRRLYEIELKRHSAEQLLALRLEQYSKRVMLWRFK